MHHFRTNSQLRSGETTADASHTVDVAGSGFWTTIHRIGPRGLRIPALQTTAKKRRGAAWIAQTDVIDIATIPTGIGTLIIANINLTDGPAIDGCPDIGGDQLH